ncbi:MAG: ABC transporter ATP-binding protein [Peptococcaceae bacterium]|nr:ABC transporter ATP-binding protein [Peptococcaceae bacterium]
MSNVTIQNVSKAFKEVTVLDTINLNIQDSSFTILLGPSGCGKSTLLRIIAGLETPDQGKVLCDNKDMTKVLPGDRNVAMVFQNYALYPHLTVYQNIEYGLKARKVKNPERTKLVTDAINMVRLEDQVKKLPAQMSGGQRQRVALARAIVKRPKIFLMDEPLSNLDAKLRNVMRYELTDLYSKLEATFLYVTHDQIEAMSMGTHIVIMNKGIIQQEGSPKAIYEDPDNLFVAGFIGSPPANILSFEGYDYSFAVRPEHMILHTTHEEHISIFGDIVSSEHLGYEAIYNIKTSIGNISVKTPNLWDNISNATVEVCIKMNKIMAFDHSGERIRDPQHHAYAISVFKQVILDRSEFLEGVV